MYKGSLPQTRFDKVIYISEGNIRFKDNFISGAFKGGKVISYIMDKAVFYNSNVTARADKVMNYLGGENTSLQGKDTEIIYGFDEGGYLQTYRLVSTFRVQLIRDGSNIPLPRNTLLYRILIYNPYIETYHTEKDIYFRIDIKTSDNNGFTTISTIYNASGEELGSYSSLSSFTKNPITGVESETHFSIDLDFTNNGSFYYLSDSRVPFEIDGEDYSSNFLPVKINLINMYKGTNPLNIWFKGQNGTNGLGVFNGYRLKDF